MYVFFVFRCFFFFKQKTAYEMRISDWSSDVCSSDRGGQQAPALPARPQIRDAIAVNRDAVTHQIVPQGLRLSIEPDQHGDVPPGQIGRASSRERVGQYV